MAPKSPLDTSSSLEQLERHVHKVARDRHAWGKRRKLNQAYLQRLGARLKDLPKPKKPKKKPKSKPNYDPIVFKYSQGRTLHVRSRKKQQRRK